jgi:simple sugar transport system permease protein
MAKEAASSGLTTEERTTTAAPAAAGRRSRIAEFLLARREVSILVVAIVLAAYFQSVNSAFLSQGNIRTLAQFTAANAIIAAGLVMLLICGEIDLSVGQAYGFMPIAMYLADQTLVLPIAILVGLAATALIGLINGVVTVYLRVPSFITTLGMLFLLNGLNVTLTDGFPKPTPEESTLTNALGGEWAGIIWALVIVFLMHVLLTRTRWGLHTFATGGNLVGAQEAGVKVARIKIGNFMLCSVLGGFAGLIEALRIESIDPLAGGPNLMFAAVSAAVIGGTALAGGVGTIIGAFLGTVVLSILQNGFTLQGVDAYTYNIILGIAILGAMILNVYVGRLRRTGGT